MCDTLGYLGGRPRVFYLSKSQMKKTRVMYSDRMDYVECLSIEEQANLFNCILMHANALDCTPMPAVKAVRWKIKKTMDKDQEKRDETSQKRKEAAKARRDKKMQMHASASKSMQLPYDTETDTETDNDTDTVNDNNIISNNTIKKDFDGSEYLYVKNFIDSNSKKFAQIHTLVKKKWYNEYLNQQCEDVEKLLKQWFTHDSVKAMLDFISDDDFWSNNIMSVSKLNRTNKEWVKYYAVILDKMNQNIQKPKETTFTRIY